MTALGEIKQAVISEKVARAMVEEYPQVDVSTGISFNQFQSWVASNRRPELKDSLNKWIAEIKLTPEYTELERSLACPCIFMPKHRFINIAVR